MESRNDALESRFGASTQLCTLLECWLGSPECHFDTRESNGDALKHRFDGTESNSSSLERCGDCSESRRNARKSKFDPS